MSINMEELSRIGVVYCARERETSPPRCFINLTRRLPLLSSDNISIEECFEEWTVITGQPESMNKKLCLCGHFIENVYYYKNERTGNICQIGSKCCERINNNVLKEYKKSLIKSGSCHVCDTVNKNIETHINSEGHKKKYKIFMEKFKKTLSNLVIDKICFIEDEKNVLSMKFINSRLNKFIKIHITKQELNEYNYNKYKDMRRCIEPWCFEYISKKEPEWKTRCKTCYIYHKNGSSNSW